MDNDPLDDPGLRAVRRKDNEFILPVARPACFHNPLRERSADSPSFQRLNAMDLGVSPRQPPRGRQKVEPTPPPVEPMPPEFQLIHPRRVRWSGWFEQPDGQMAHFIGSNDATPEQEAWYRLNDPERGLSLEDRHAYRKSQRGPVVKFFARLKFWRSKVEGECEVPRFMRHHAD